MGGKLPLATAPLLMTSSVEALARECIFCWKTMRAPNEDCGVRSAGADEDGRSATLVLEKPCPWACPLARCTWPARLFRCC